MPQEKQNVGEAERPEGQRVGLQSVSFFTRSSLPLATLGTALPCNSILRGKAWKSSVKPLPDHVSLVGDKIMSMVLQTEHIFR